WFPPERFRIFVSMVGALIFRYWEYFSTRSFSCFLFTKAWEDIFPKMDRVIFSRMVISPTYPSCFLSSLTIKKPFLMASRGDWFRHFRPSTQIWPPVFGRAP